VLLGACKELVDLQQGASDFSFIFCDWDQRERQAGEGRQDVFLQDVLMMFLH